MVGDRWALMIVRDLLIGPKRFSDLRTALPKIPTNVLTTRLKQLEAAGVAARRALPRPAGGVVYELDAARAGARGRRRRDWTVGRSGAVRVRGNRRLFERFAKIFRI
ncbi:MAG: helix-turn-helix domain-containing protein [Candidatus Cybelea sp.]